MAAQVLQRAERALPTYLPYRELQQPGGGGNDDYRTERLHLRMAQSLYLPVDIKILLGMELKAKLGLQPETIGETKIWVLPNPSGLNANYQPGQLVELFGKLRQAV